MTQEEKIQILRQGLEELRECTFAEFQNEAPSRREFQLDRHVCPYCRRASTADHLHDMWAKIQSITVDLLRQTDPAAG